MKKLETDEKLLLRVEHAAELCDVSRSTFYNLINQGRVPVVRIGRTVRIPRAWLEMWIRREVSDWSKKSGNIPGTGTDNSMIDGRG
jgi:excisionase family DNA binding protein